MLLDEYIWRHMWEIPCDEDICDIFAIISAPCGWKHYLSDRFLENIEDLDDEDEEPPVLETTGGCFYCHKTPTDDCGLCINVYDGPLCSECMDWHLKAEHEVI